MLARFRTTRGDIFGGLTAGVVALPLCLAFGVASGLGAEAGLYGGIIVGILASLFGGTPVQISGPTAPMTLIASTIVITHTLPSGEINIPNVLAVFLLAGLFQMLFGILRLGQFIRFLPYPVISGLMTGIGIIILTQQIFPLLGMVSPASDPVVIIYSLGSLSSGFNPAAALLAALTIILIFVLPRFIKKLPASLIALVGLTILSVVAGLSVPIIGQMPAGLPHLTLPNFTWSESKLLIWAALQLAFLGSIDSLTTSLVADNITKTRHKSNQELIGQGIGNMTSALFGGLPGAGAFVRTAINVRAGGRHCSSGIIHGLFLLLVLLGFSGIVQYIPNAVLAGILVGAGLGIIDYRSLSHMLRAPRSDVLVMLMVIVLTIFAGMVTAVGAGMIVAALIFMVKVASISEKNTVLTLAEEELWGDEITIPEPLREHLLIKHVTGPLFFGFVYAFRVTAASITRGKILVLRMEQVSYLDQSGLYALQDVMTDIEALGIQVYMVGLADCQVDCMKSIHIIPHVLSEERIFADFDAFKKALPQILASLPAETEFLP
ncbi:SulP family inorganic anion transporter [Klebsiella sp. BIGb0407]|uniref:SulP family inorganic anion transporter n=1 Tax=Klebsiella sp. BIGb0407 TaxID=2940603 RepID=UPI002167BFD6|nr:SulP family inorganic anion transporter [Klebsiella sp. BIGb0407]MCS3430937.1 SulP family sulfate permease [Klebsiella sp. BIGb0407]